jgi:hypothetical protein
LHGRPPRFGRLAEDLPRPDGRHGIDRNYWIPLFQLLESRIPAKEFYPSPAVDKLGSVYLGSVYSDALGNSDANGEYVNVGSRVGPPLLGEGTSQRKDRARCSLYHLIDDVPGEPVTQPGPSMRAHNDDVALHFLRHLQDHFGWVTFLDPSVNGEVGGDLEETGEGVPDHHFGGVSVRGRHDV